MRFLVSEFDLSISQFLNRLTQGIASMNPDGMETLGKVWLTLEVPDEVSEIFEEAATRAGLSMSRWDGD